MTIYQLTQDWHGYPIGQLLNTNASNGLAQAAYSAGVAMLAPGYNVGSPIASARGAITMPYVGDSVGILDGFVSDVKSTVNKIISPITQAEQTISGTINNVGGTLTGMSNTARAANFALSVVGVAVLATGAYVGWKNRRGIARGVGALLKVFA